MAHDSDRAAVILQDCMAQMQVLNLNEQELHVAGDALIRLRAQAGAMAKIAAVQAQLSKILAKSMGSAPQPESKLDIVF